jgi:beta-phosphoglucomutase-like phosphatase (HAD superfamily)
MLSLEKGMSVQLHRFINKLKQDYTIDRIFMDCHPVFAHEYALSKLRAQGYSLAVASNSIRDTVEMMMKKSNLLPYLNFFLSNQDVSNAKPHPEIYQVAVEKLELNPSECLVLEDNRNGIEAAKAAGTHVMQVSTIFDVNYENINRNIELAENGRI